MVKIRLRRVGLKNQPSFRIVAADKEKPRDGRFLEILGFYNPRTEPSTIEVKEERVYYWLSNGAQLSESVEKIFKQVGLLERYERFREGEELNTLLAESKEFFDRRIVNQKTKRNIEQNESRE